jgi:hypothetical protein
MDASGREGLLVREMGKPTAGILRQRWATGSDKAGSDPAPLYRSAILWGEAAALPEAGDREKGDALPYQQNNGQRAR